MQNSNNTPTHFQQGQDFKTWILFCKKDVKLFSFHWWLCYKINMYNVSKLPTSSQLIHD